MGRPKTIITKAELAAVLGLSKARISQLCKREDFPVRPDGRVSREAAVRWYKDAGLADRATKRGPKRKQPRPPRSPRSIPPSPPLRIMSAPASGTCLTGSAPRPPNCRVYCISWARPCRRSWLPARHSMPCSGPPWMIARTATASSRSCMARRPGGNRVYRCGVGIESRHCPQSQGDRGN